MKNTLREKLLKARWWNPLHWVVLILGLCTIMISCLIVGALIGIMTGIVTAIDCTMDTMKDIGGDFMDLVAGGMP